MSPSEMLVSDAVAITFGNRILGEQIYKNISYLTVMSLSKMLVSDAVAVTFGNRILGE